MGVFPVSLSAVPVVCVCQPVSFLPLSQQKKESHEPGPPAAFPWIQHTLLQKNSRGDVCALKAQSRQAQSRDTKDWWIYITYKQLLIHTLTPTPTPPSPPPAPPLSLSLSLRRTACGIHWSASVQDLINLCNYLWVHVSSSSQCLLLIEFHVLGGALYCISVTHTRSPIVSVLNMSRGIKYYKVLYFKALTASMGINVVYSNRGIKPFSMGKLRLAKSIHQKERKSFKKNQNTVVLFKCAMRRTAAV